MAQQFDVTVTREGGSDKKVIRVTASSPGQARAAAEAMANAESQAQRKTANYKARQVVSVF